MQNYIQDGVEHCAACRVVVEPKHRCDNFDLVKTSLQYRRTLEALLNNAAFEETSSGEEVLISMKAINEARKELGWEKL